LGGRKPAQSKKKGSDVFFALWRRMPPVNFLPPRKRIMVRAVKDSGAQDAAAKGVRGKRKKTKKQQQKAAPTFLL
jgi:hypothetical protein